jgi:hypothetical protein
LYRDEVVGVFVRFRAPASAVIRIHGVVIAMGEPL